MYQSNSGPPMGGGSQGGGSQGGSQGGGFSGSNAGMRYSDAIHMGEVKRKKAAKASKTK